MIGRNPRLLRSGRQGPAFAARMWRQLAVHDRFQGEFWNRARDGRLYPLLQTITVLRDEVGASPTMSASAPICRGCTRPSSVRITCGCMTR